MDTTAETVLTPLTQERIAEHLQKHAGDGDILDSLIASFGGSCSAPRASKYGLLWLSVSLTHHSSLCIVSSTSPKKKKFLGSTASKGGSGTMGKPAMRSRSDQYFFENQY